MFNNASHPKTCALLEIALRIGQFQVMHYKWIYQRMQQRLDVRVGKAQCRYTLSVNTTRTL